MAQTLWSTPARTAWLVAAGMALAVSAGCGGHDRPAPAQQQPAQPTASGTDPAVVYCQGHIDALIAADIVPRSDRDYAMGMCETQQHS